MKGVHHPCILECNESFVHGANIFIVMPHCAGGDLSTLLARQKKKRKRLPEDVIVDWFAQIILGKEEEKEEEDGGGEGSGRERVAIRLLEIFFSFISRFVSSAQGTPRGKSLFTRPAHLRKHKTSDI